MLSAVVLTRNEEKNIERCLKSLTFCDEIIVVDDYSTDKTLQRIQNTKINVQVFQRKLNKDFAEQRNYGLSKAKNSWVLFIDADEEVSPGLRGEIKKTIATSNNDAYFIRRRDYFFGKELRFGEVKAARNTGILRLVKKDSGKWMGDVHEVFHTAKNIGKLEAFLNHYPHPTIKEFLSDVNYYSDIRAEELFTQGKRANILEIIFIPPFKFIYTFLISLGFLDGAAGFAYAFIMSFHSFLVRAKLYQYQNKT